MTTVDVKHEVKLVDSTFTATEASDVIASLIEQKINFHTLRRLSMSEGDINCDTSYDDSRLSQLIKERKHFKEICREARAAGKRMRVSGMLEIELID